MFKKIVKGMVAAATVLSMSMSVMAAGSIVGAIDMPNVSASEGKVSLSKVVADTYEAELQAVVDRLNQARPEVTVEEAFGDKLSVVNLYNADGMKMEDVDLSEYKFLSPVMDLQITEAVPTEENPVKVTFVANNITDNIEVSVLHYCEEHEWELLETEKISSNQVAADFHSASPVALIYKEKATVEVGTDVKSPKTGQTSPMMLIAGIVVFAGFGVYAVKRSRKEA